MRIVKWSFLLLFMLSILSVSARSQTASTAVLSGRVTDPSGAVVPAAQVTLHEITTNATRVQETTENGQYVFSAVDRGSYTLTVAKNGFETATVTNLHLDVTKSYTEDVALRVGTTATIVEVSIESGLELQTTDATIGNLVSGNDIVRLPTQSRNATELLSLQPGSMQRASLNGADNSFNTSGGAVAGARADQNVVSLDGIDVTPHASIVADLEPVVPLSVDAISEFRVGISNPNATFGNAGGAQESVASRSGGNAFHGVGYWYNQNSVFNANEWDNNAAGLKRPQDNDNRVGVSIGGPIQRDRTFFFSNYEVRRYSQALRTERLVPSADLRNGFLTYGGNRYNVKNFDPRGIGISPTIQSLWNMLPQGNDPNVGDGVNILGYLSNVSAPLKDDTISFRLDHSFRSNLHFFGRYQYSRDLNTDQQADLAAAASGGAAKFLGTQANRGDIASTGLDWIIRPSLINSFRFGRVRSRQDTDTIGDLSVAAKYNLPGTASADGPVSLQVANLNSTSVPYHLDLPTESVPPRSIQSTSYQFRDDLNWTKGAHSIAFGADVVRLPIYFQDSNRIQQGNIAITAIVDGDQNVLSVDPSNRPSNLDPVLFGAAWDRLYASALGLVDSTAVAVARDGNFNPLPPGTPYTLHVTQGSYYFYAQDTWRVRPSVTLSLGISYGWEKPPTERDGKLITLTDANGTPLDTTKYLALKQSMALNGQIYNPTVYHLPYTKAGLPGYWNTDWNDVAPRVSVAWSPSGGSGFLGKILGEKKTVIRGGYGIVYDRTYFPTEALTGTGFGQNLSAFLPLCNDPVAVSGPGCNGGSSNPALSAFRVGIDGPNIPVPAPDIKPTLPIAEGIGSVPPDFWDYEVDANYKLGRNHLLDLSIQRQFAKNNMLEIGYLGRLGRRLPNNLTLNAVPYMFRDGGPNGQPFALAFDCVAQGLRGLTPPAGCAAPPSGSLFANQPWFEDQLPAGFGNGCGPGSTNVSNTQCIAIQQANNFINGNLSPLFGVFAAIDGARAAAGLPQFVNHQQADLQVHHSNDFSNYHALTVTWRNNGWSGLNFDLNYTFSKSLDNGGRVQVYGNGYDDAFNPKADYGPSFFDRTHTFNGTFSYELPVGRRHRLSSDNRGVNGIIGGWYVGGIFTAATGVPLIATQSFAYGGGVVTTNPVGEIPTGSISTGVNRTANGINLFADPAKVFTEFRPILLSSDNRSGRDSPFRGFGSWNLDFRIGKETSITERVKAEFSADFFNVFNHVVFNDPGSGAAQGGLDLTSGPNNFGAASSQAIPADRIGGSRWIELGLRISF
jgi:hypothetical protein